MAWAPDYADADALANYLRIDDTADDAELALAVTAASRAIDHHTNRQFGQVAIAEGRTYVARYDYERCRWVVDVDDFDDATGLTVEVDGDAVATFEQRPRNAAQTGWPWTRIEFTADSEHEPDEAPHEVTVEALWGWSTVPDGIKQAALLQASRLFSRRVAPFGVAGSPDTGSEMRLLARVDPDVAVALRPFRRPRAVA